MEVGGQLHDFWLKDLKDAVPLAERGRVAGRVVWGELGALRPPVT